LVVSDAAKLLKTVEALLESSKATDSDARLVIPILIATGRRVSELCNGRSSFMAGEHPYSCWFSGQLKARGEQRSYLIPLPVPFAALAKALAAFRQKQIGPSMDKRRSSKVVSELSNLEVKKRYAFPLSCAITRNTFVTLPKCKLHDLRGLYGALTWELLTPGNMSFSRHLMAVLGHKTLNESLSYTHWRVEGCDGLRGVIGPMPSPPPPTAPTVPPSPA
jgi:integrase